MPPAPVPPRLEFHGEGEFESLSPALYQPFFIGDGLQRGTGIPHTFAVPDAADVVQVGFAEGVPCFEGPFGGYCDNLGELRATLSFEESCLAIFSPHGDRVLCVGGGGDLATDARGTGPVEFQWEAAVDSQWMALSDGPMPTGGGTQVRGSTTSTLVLTNAQVGDFTPRAGKTVGFPILMLRLRATGCDNTKIVAHRTVHLRSPDFNGDGNVDQDDLWYILGSKNFEDLNEDESVDMDDVAYLINWIASDPSACR